MTPSTPAASCRSAAMKWRAGCFRRTHPTCRPGDAASEPGSEPSCPIVEHAENVSGPIEPSSAVARTGVMDKKARKPAETWQGYRYHSPDIPMSAIRRYSGQMRKNSSRTRSSSSAPDAYGQPHEWSDVDLLVVMPARNQIDQSIQIIKALEAPFSLDLIVRTPKRLQRHGGWSLVLARSSWRRARSFMKRLTAKWVRKAEDDLIGARCPRNRLPLTRPIRESHCRERPRSQRPSGDQDHRRVRPLPGFTPRRDQTSPRAELGKSKPQDCTHSRWRKDRGTHFVPPVTLRA